MQLGPCHRVGAERYTLSARDEGFGRATPGERGSGTGGRGQGDGGQCAVVIDSLVGSGNET